MLISSINEIISQVNFQTSGKVTLFHLSEDTSVCARTGSTRCGIVVADTEFDLASTEVTLPITLE